MCASHCSLLWLEEQRLNLHLIRLLCRGSHSSCEKALEVSCRHWTVSMAWLRTPTLCWRLTRTADTPRIKFSGLQHSLIKLNNALIWFWWGKCDWWFPHAVHTTVKAIKADLTKCFGGLALCCSEVWVRRKDTSTSHWLGHVQHPSANGSYGQRCGHSHKLTQVLGALMFYFSPP